MVAKKKDRTVLIIVIAVLGMFCFQFLPVVALFGLYAMIGGGALGFAYFIDKGEVHVVCPADHECRVTVDGGSPEDLEGGTHLGIELKRGRHVVRIDDRTSGKALIHDIDVTSGFSKKVAPSTADQCFVRLDVTEAMYGGRLRNDFAVPLPTVTDRYAGREPFDLPSSTYLTEVDMPTSLEEGYHAYLLIDIGCDRMDMTDAEILALLGFAGAPGP